MKKSLFTFIAILSILSLAGCQNDKGSTTITGSDTQSSQTSSSQETSSTTSDSTTEIIPSTTVEIMFNNIDTIKGGSDLNDQGQIEPFTKLFNDAHPDLLESYESTKVFVQELDADDGTSSNHLTIGSGSSEGTITLNFLKDIKEINIKARAYYNYVQYDGSWHNDTTCSLNIVFGNLNETMVLEDATSSITPIASQNFVFEETAKSITLSNIGSDHNRVLIESLSLTF